MGLQWPLLLMGTQVSPLGVDRKRAAVPDLDRLSVRLSFVALVMALITTMLPAVPAVAATCPDAGGGTLRALPDLDEDIVFRGRGFGHGTGMSQYGAYGAAKLGCTHEDILSTYYPGTVHETRASEGLRVSLNTSSIKTTIRAESGDVRWQVCAPDGTGCAYVHTQPQGETWIARVLQNSATPTSAIRVERLVSGGWELVEEHPEDHIVRVVLSSVNRDPLGPVATVDDGGRNRKLARGVIEIDTAENGSDRAFVTLLIGMEQYLYGISEVSSMWPTEVLRAQAVAARSYAYSRIDLRVAQHGPAGDPVCRCHLYSSTYDQNYVGYGKESESVGATNYGQKWVDAVVETSEVVMTYNGAPIPAFYASIHGGASESYAFWGGGKELPYLVAVDDSAWEAAAGADLSAWALGVSVEELGAALGIGVVTDAKLPSPKGEAGRVGIPKAGYGGVVITGTTGTWRGSGTELRTALSVLGPDCSSRSATGEVQRLCSTNFTIDLNIGPRPIPPPAGATRVTGDWNGDGQDTPGWFKNGEWGMHDSLSGTEGVTTLLSYGAKGDVPLVGDWDGDGIDTVGVVRDGNLFILRNEYRKGAKDIVMRYGQRGDVPVAGDWDGNGTDTLGVVRGNLFILRNEYRRGAKDIVLAYGEDSDAKVTGDWNGDGRDTLGVVRGNLWILRSVYRRGANDVRMAYGNASDIKVTGDWDGDGTDTLGVVRSGTWIVRDEYVRSAADTTFKY